MSKAALLSSSRVIKIAFVSLLVSLTASPSTRSAMPTAAALACACCADTGQWYERKARLESYEISELQNIKLGPVAKLYTTEAGYEALKGLSVQTGTFNLLAREFNAGRPVTLTFKGEGGTLGALILHLPRVATSFGADLYDHEEGSAGPILYKEWRFEGMASGNGIFRKGMAPGTKFRLVFQGRGNNCLSSTDFRNWRLDIAGPRASYAFYGSLVNPSS
jgi:hypothetical protein